MTETHPQNRCLGYARVNTYGQTLNAQLEQLRPNGCATTLREKVTAPTGVSQPTRLVETMSVTPVHVKDGTEIRSWKLPLQTSWSIWPCGWRVSDGD